MQNIIFLLFWIGLLRGALEVVWIFAINHRLIELLFLSRKLSWWYLESGPFILANIFTAYSRWAMYSLIFYLGLNFLKIKADFFRILKLFSIIMWLYVLTILANFLHCFFNISMIKFDIAPLYTYSAGIGQWVSSCLLIFFVYKLGRHFKSDKLSSLLIALLVFSADRAFYFFSAWFYFRLPFISEFSHKKIFVAANHLNSLTSILLTLLFLWLGFRLNAQRKTNI